MTNGLYYPLYKLKKDDESIKIYNFKIANKFLNLTYEIFSSYMFMELNYKNELILRKSTNSIVLYKDTNPSLPREFKSKKKIISCYSLSNNTYLLSCLSKEEKHYLILLDKNLKIIKEQQLGLTSWHSQDSIDEKDGVLMYSEYNVAKQPTKVSIFRSFDMGISWKEVFFQNHPSEIRHWHTLQADLKTKNYWLATSGDTPEQSRWFLSKDNGDSWNEITDKKYKNLKIPTKSLSAHRTTSIYDDGDRYYWATDDLMGTPKDYFTVVNSERKASSQFYTSKKSQPLKIEKLTNLGVHIRSMIDIEKGFLFFSEGKYATYNTQVFYIDKSNLAKPYFLFNIPSEKPQGGTYSLASRINQNGEFYIKHIIKGSIKTLKFKIDFSDKLQNIRYDVSNYIRFVEHLWFLDNTKSISNIIFLENKVKLELDKKENIFYMLLGDSKWNQQNLKKLYKVPNDNFSLSFNVEKQNTTTSIKLYIQFYNNEKKVSSKSFTLKDGYNDINITKKDNELYIKILFRVEHTTKDKIELSELIFTNEVKKEQTIDSRIDDLEYIEDEKSNRLYYRLNLQKKPNTLPLLVVLHGHESQTTKFQFDGWNVLSPLDNFGYKNHGSWWLGENGDFFLKNLLQKLITKISTKYNCQNNIYFYGSSMGGYGAILHGILSKARAVYANVPQIHLYGSNYFTLSLTKNIAKVLDLNSKLPIENDLTNILEQNLNEKLPVFFLCENSIQESRIYKNYLQEHTMKFAQRCIENNIKLHLELLPQVGHTKNYGLKEVVNKFIKFTPPEKVKTTTCNKNNFQLSKENWFSTIKDIQEQLHFENNTLSFISNNLDDTTFYITSSNPSISKMDNTNKINYKIINCTTLLFNIDIEFKNCNIKFYILQFDENTKLDTKSFKLHNGQNKIKYIKCDKSKYLKVAFRIEKTIPLKNLEIKINKILYGDNNKFKFEVYDYANINDINSFKPNIKYDGYLHHKIDLNILDMDILSYFKSYSKKLVVFYNGAVDLKKTPLPTFQRWSWLEKLPYSAMIVSDPTIKEMSKIIKNDTLIGWYQGSKDKFILKEIIFLIKKISKELNIKEEDILFYGSSAGGFASLASLSILTNSKACVVNPQINILDYHGSFISNLMKYLEKKDNDLNNMDIKQLFSHIDKIPQIYYKQNILDELHYKKHYLPFKEFCIKKQKNFLYEELIEDTKGHSAIPSYEEALVDINKTFNIFSDYNDISDRLLKKDLINFELFTFVKNESNLYNFKPRKDSPNFQLKLPLDWNLDPFNDRNWTYQLHSWRMLDNNFSNYQDNNDITKLLECLNIIDDWKRYAVTEKQEAVMSWNDMATGLRALKIAYLINHLFKKYHISMISKEQQNLLIEMATLHIKELRKQEISLNNHGIFQVHGLLMLSWLFDDKESIQYALKHMRKLLAQQFYSDGFHSENSDDYHWFIYKTFNNILDFDLYQNDPNIKETMQLANSCKVWTVFPNKEALLIGDTSNGHRKVDFSSINDEAEYIIKFFEDSGYIFIRSSFNTNKNKASMLFFQTAYKNMTHKHADDFNILLYEYGLNILVDTGKYSYEEKLDKRLYCRSTKAHNCLEINNLNYEFKGKYYYKSALKIHEELDNNIFHLQTSIQRKDIEVFHNRNIIYKPKEFLIIIDRLESKQKRDYKQHWHFHQNLEIVKENDIFTTKIKEGVDMIIESYSIDLNNDQRYQENSLIKAQTKPELQGWRSLKYKELIPNYALSNIIKTKNAILVTKFLFKNNKVDININKEKKKILCSLSSNTLKINQDFDI